MDITLKNQKIWSPGDLQFNSAWFWTLLSTCGGLIRNFQKKKIGLGRFYAKSALKSLCRRSGMAVKAKRRIHCGMGLLKVSSEAILQALGRLGLGKRAKRGGK